MNYLNQILNEMDKRGTKEVKVGDITIERYNPTPKESIENIGKAIRVRERLEKERREKKVNPNEWKRVVEKWGKFEQEYLNSTQGN